MSDRQKDIRQMILGGAVMILGAYVIGCISLRVIGGTTGSILGFAAYVVLLTVVMVKLTRLARPRGRP